MMKVYVVECGCYTERYVKGVYASVDAAIADNPIPRSSTRKLRSGGWQQSSDGIWTNGFDWEEAKEIQEHEVQGLAETN